MYFVSINFLCGIKLKACKANCKMGEFVLVYGGYIVCVCVFVRISIKMPR